MPSYIVHHFYRTDPNLLILSLSFEIKISPRLIWFSKNVSPFIYTFITVSYSQLFSDCMSGYKLSETRMLINETKCTCLCVQNSTSLRAVERE